MKEVEAKWMEKGLTKTTLAEFLLMTFKLAVSGK